MADELEDEDTPRKSKKLFQEREAPHDEDDGRPRKKRRVVDDGPRVKTNDNIPILMLFAFIGSAVALMVICAGCGFWSFDALVLGGKGSPGGGGGGWGGGGKEFEVSNVTRTPGFRAFDAPRISYTVTTKQSPNTSNGQYYLVMKCGGQTVAVPINPLSKGSTQTGNNTHSAFRGLTGKLEVWVEKRRNPVAEGEVVSNVYELP